MPATVASSQGQSGQAAFNRSVQAFIDAMQAQGVSAAVGLSRSMTWSSSQSQSAATQGLLLGTGPSLYQVYVQVQAHAVLVPVVTSKALVPRDVADAVIPDQTVEAIV